MILTGKNSGTEEKIEKKSYIILPIILTIIVGSGMAFCAYNMFQSQEIQGYIRQVTEERIAKTYIEDVNSDEVATGTRIEMESEYVDSDLDYTDDTYHTHDGITWTPDYAVGTLDCVLEIPAINLRRGVYIGTSDEIQQDLDAWMTVAAQPDYKLGVTHYAIYGHNSPTQALSFNNLKDVVVGDYFILTTDTFVYLYDVDDIVAEWRPTVTRKYVCNYETSTDICYIITCGRGEYACRDLVVVGKLREKYTLKVWETAKNDIVATKVEHPVEVEYALEKMNLSAAIKNAALEFMLTYPDGSPCEGEEICLMNADGLFVQDSAGEEVILVTDENGWCSISKSELSEEAVYVAGLYDFEETEYQTANDIKITFSTETKMTEEIVVEDVGDEESMTDYYMYIWAGFIVILFIAFAICIIETIKIAKRLRLEGKK